MTGNLIIFSAVEQPELYPTAQQLVAEYVAATAREMDTEPEEFLPYIEGYSLFPGVFSPSSQGDFLLAQAGETPAGCVGIKRLTPDVCEMKTLWTRADFRGQGVGRALIEASLERARKLGYKEMFLDVLPSREGAVKLYRSLGFQPSPLAHDYHFEMLGFRLRLTS